jgi:hypothetical protein
MAAFSQYEALANRIWRIWGKSFPEGTPKPVAIRDWDGPGRHAVVWEEGPYEWTTLTEGGRDEEFGFTWKPIPAPKGHYLEALTYYAVSIAD